MMERGAKDDEPTKWLGTARVAVGVAQGIILYLLVQAARTEAWPASAPPAFAAASLVGSFVPLILLDGLGHLRRRTLLVWVLAAGAALAGLAVHDIARRGGGGGGVAAMRHLPSPVLVASAAAALFIAHNLLTAADAARRPLAPYTAYFDGAWRTGLQLALSAAFLAVFWGLLTLGAALFGLIGIDTPSWLIERDWFRILASAGVFAAGVHLTDVKPSLTRGMRGLALLLLSWLLPVMALIVIAFLVALPFTGLDPLWATRHATAVLLAAAAALVVLINAAHQDGEAPPPRPVRLAARAVALALTPLVAIAAWGLWLRIGQHGLTPDRVIAAACIVLAACYAAGYGAAVVLPSRWQASLEGTNILAAFVALGTILALLTPLADPARLSVANQLRRLERGEVSAGRFDFAFLRFGSGRYGIEALERLRSGEAGPGTAELAAKAEEMLRRTRPERSVRQARAMTAEERAARITVHPAGQGLPESFLRHALADGGPASNFPCLHGPGGCEAFLIDMDEDGAPEVLLAGIGWIGILRSAAEGRWAVAGTLPLGRCAGVIEALREGRFALVAPTWRDLEVDGRRLRLRTGEAC